MLSEITLGVLKKRPVWSLPFMMRKHFEQNCRKISKDTENYTKYIFFILSLLRAQTQPVKIGTNLQDNKKQLIAPKFITLQKIYENTSVKLKTQQKLRFDLIKQRHRGLFGTSFILCWMFE